MKHTQKFAEVLVIFCPLCRYNIRQAAFRLLDVHLYVIGWLLRGLFTWYAAFTVNAVNYIAPQHFPLSTIKNFEGPTVLSSAGGTLRP